MALSLRAESETLGLDISRLQDEIAQKDEQSRSADHENRRLRDEIVSKDQHINNAEQSIGRLRDEITLKDERFRAAEEDIERLHDEISLKDEQLNHQHEVRPSTSLRVQASPTTHDVEASNNGTFPGTPQYTSMIERLLGGNGQPIYQRFEMVKSFYAAVSESVGIAHVEEVEMTVQSHAFRDDERMLVLVLLTPGTYLRRLQPILTASEDVIREAITFMRSSHHKVATPTYQVLVTSDEDYIEECWTGNKYLFVGDQQALDQLRLKAKTRMESGRGTASREDLVLYGGPNVGDESHRNKRRRPDSE